MIRIKLLIEQNEMSLKVNPSFSIEKGFQMVFNKLKLNINQFLFYFDGNLLQYQSTFDDFGIADGDCIDCSQKSNINYQPSFTSFVPTPTDSYYSQRAIVFNSHFLL